MKVISRDFLSAFDKRMNEPGELVFGQAWKEFLLTEADGSLKEMGNLTTIDHKIGSDGFQQELTLTVRSWIIKMGRLRVASSASGTTTATANFITPFPNAGIAVIGSQSSNDPVSGLMMDVSGKTGVTVSYSGGVSNEVFAYIAFGN